MQIAPPYVLVGHSYGGVLSRGFAASFPKEVSGVAYIEVPDFEATRQERASVLPASERERALADPDLPPIPPDVSAGLRAEIEILAEDFRKDWPEARLIPEVTGVPIAVVIAAPPGRLAGNGAAMMRLQIKHQSEWALKSVNGLLLMSGRVGHFVQRDDPNLVVQAVKHVLTPAVPGR
jgi:pimeloyl-ACP methyl ester carboxylesterase